MSVGDQTSQIHAMTWWHTFETWILRMTLLATSSLALSCSAMIVVPEAQVRNKVELG